MNKDGWKEIIKDACEQAGTYKPFFDSIIDTLAEILENRDKAKEQFESLGGQVIVKHTNKAGATNLTQNPALRAINDLNRDALSYWRELGLTSKAYKELKGMVIEEKTKMSALEEALLNIGGAKKLE